MGYRPRRDPTARARVVHGGGGENVRAIDRHLKICGTQQHSRVLGTRRIGCMHQAHNWSPSLFCLMQNF